jgi:hypothetical protein
MFALLLLLIGLFLFLIVYGVATLHRQLTTWKDLMITDVHTVYVIKSLSFCGTGPISTRKTNRMKVNTLHISSQRDVTYKLHIRIVFMGIIWCTKYLLVINTNLYFNRILLIPKLHIETGPLHIELLLSDMWTYIYASNSVQYNKHCIRKTACLVFRSTDSICFRNGEIILFSRWTVGTFGILHTYRIFVSFGVVDIYRIFVSFEVFLAQLKFKLRLSHNNEIYLRSLETLGWKLNLVRLKVLPDTSVQPWHYRIP